jgi:type I restriction enzyme S subunit
MFESKKLKDISLSIGSGITPRRDNKSYWENGTIPWLKTEQLGEKNVYDTNEKISQIALDETSMKLFPVNTLSMAMYGEGRTRGNVSILKKEMATNQACCNIVIDGKKADYEFVYYYLKTQYEQLRGLSSGVRKNLNSNDIKEYRIRLPSKISEQQKIAAVLSALDAKIELNQRINAELEQMAKTLYDYWFVQFDFPNEEGKPYKSAGGKMVWNEELKREIPLGWEMGGLGDILSLEYGKPLKEEDRSGNGYPVLGSNGIVGYHKDYFVEGYGIVVGRKGTAGAVVWVEDNFFPIDTTFYVKDKLGVSELFFHYQLLLRTNFKQLESSSAVPGLNRNFAYSIKVVIPEKSIIQEFNEIVKPIFSKIKTCNKESQTLTELRDWLLPMLMNGQVGVSAL